MEQRISNRGNDEKISKFDMALSGALVEILNNPLIKGIALSDATGRHVQCHGSMH
jgi:hypothetical protein